MAAFYNTDDKTPPPDKIPEELTEFMIIQETGWTLEYIRGLKEKDYQKISIMSHISQQIKNNREGYKMRLAASRPTF